MKFGKELAAQMVQEWREAYMHYNNLKTILKEVLRLRQKNAPPPVAATTKRALKRRVSLYRAFSGLTSRYKRSQSRSERSEDETILVDYVEGTGEGDGQYQTMFLMSTDEGSGEHELVFFRKLDDEFNKVVRFYKKKVEEVMVEADELSKQMEALIALRIRVDEPVLLVGTNMVNLAGSFNGIITGKSQMGAIQEVEMSREGHMEEENTRGGNENGREGTIKGFRPAPLEVLDHVKIKIEPETPVSTIKVVLTGSISDMSFTKGELTKAEVLMKQAFIEFYQKLRFLKSYR